MLKLHWAVLGHLWNTGITLAEVIGQYHTQGVVSLRRRPLCLCDMTADRAPVGGDCDRSEAPVAARGSAPCGAGDREAILLVVAVAAAPNAPQRGDRKICKLFVFSICFIRVLLQCGSSRSMSPPADHRASLSSQLKCAHLVPAKAPLPEEAIFNQKQAATKKRRAARKAQHKKCHIAKRDRTITSTRGEGGGGWRLLR
jgi:hypothetical protein